MWAIVHEASPDKNIMKEGPKGNRYNLLSRFTVEKKYTDSIERITGNLAVDCF